MFKRLQERIYTRSLRSKDTENLLKSVQGLSGLFVEQSRAVFGIIDKEVLVSYRFGLELTKADLKKEKQAIVLSLSVLGKLREIPSLVPEFEIARRRILDSVSKAMEEELALYFEKYKISQKVNRNVYQCHLEVTISRILNIIYSKDESVIPYLTHDPKLPQGHVWTEEQLRILEEYRKESR